MTDGRDRKSRAGKESQDRDGHLAAALRDNLRRRKAQQRRRKAQQRRRKDGLAVDKLPQGSREIKEIS